MVRLGSGYLCEIPPLASGLRSRDKSGDISRGERDSSLPLANMVGKLALVGDLGSPPAQGGSFIAILST